MTHGQAKKHLGSVKNYKPGKPVEEVERELGVRNAVKLASNENALGPSPKALRAAAEALRRVHQYPDGGCYYLRKALARRLGVLPEELIFGNGSDEILVFAARAYVGPGDEVVIADPTFLIYEIAAQVERGRVVKVPMRDFHYDLDAMARRVTRRTKLIFIANPDNPVGTYISQDALRRFLARIPRRTVVVLDEAYFEFAAGEPGYPDALSLRRRYPNLLVTRTFSKAYGLAGLRIGYGVSRPDIIASLNKVREPFNVNLPAQAAAIAALGDRAHVASTLRMVRRGRRSLWRGLRAMGLRVVETATNFILVDLGRDASAVDRALLKRGVIVRPMGAWGLPQFLRVTIGRPAENARFLKALREILGNDF